ncbi:MAG: cation-transporting P-type ATPase [Alphaproteobacteria bacterium]|nr:cation-transporting P-type ATPase [Alphaproteobacteria bacterium]
MKYRGLTAARVLENRRKYGANTMPEPHAKTVWQFLLDVFRDKINMILLIMTVIFAVLAVFGYGEMTEALGIGAVLVIVCIVNVVTQMRAQFSTIELRRRASKLMCNVVRGGHIRNIDSTEIVVGDTVVIQAGETIPADGYIIHGHITVNNSVLNGESAEVHKSPTPKFKYDVSATITANDYVDSNHLFAGTTVQGGGGVMHVTRVGINTENARILATLDNVADVKTTLQLQLDHLAGIIGKIGAICAVSVAVLIMAVHFIRDGAMTTGNTVYIIVSAITLGLTIFIAAVPEGLPFIIGIITSQNARKMTRANLLAKNPHKIPEAGNIQLLCTDKTGTITFGRMQPVANYLGDGTNVGFNVKSFGATVEIANNIVLNGRAMLDANGNIVGGNSTERALFGALDLTARRISAIKRAYQTIAKIPFSSARKFSATTVRSSDGVRTYVMAAPEIILAHANRYIDADGRVHSMHRARINRLMVTNARRAMRVIATAYYDGKISDNKIPDGLVFVALSIMRDEIRPGVADVVGALRESGVRVMMITGDNLETARVIASESGIIANDSDIAMDAIEFDALSDARARRILPRISVIARATPQTKLRVVELARMDGISIGMCGDGTNDAPALKGADVGFAMGDSTDVCKGASDIIIVDNNFISITNSILMGRTFMHNVVNFLRFQLPINFILVAVSILFPLFLGFDAIVAVQILIINIIIDSLNSLAFGGEAPRPEYMRERVMGKNSPLITWQTLRSIIWTTVAGVFIFTLTVLPPISNILGGPATALSARFAVLIIMAMLNGFVVRAPGYNIFWHLKSNPMFIIVALFVFAGTYLCVTFGGAALHLAPLSPVQWLTVVCMALMIIPINMLYCAIVK